MDYTTHSVCLNFRMHFELYNSRLILKLKYITDYTIRNTHLNALRV